ncbi:DUF3991 domain-containing protein [Proteiniborus sp. MB09-C3]|uniref:DUF3991 domain-containing protein n=1 Tax=Proteiniborus sp. MB09-C3 TaxID=3050072 RepID=UPI0025577D7B|nr:DUF3991 domain-containing protein [Proteiniborus sp. MB09-C3]WIV11170.1 DUF3991 domain-containing protein [Proteiniborus sp. MB09-C3]
MAYEKRRFTDEQIQSANSVNILEYASQYFDVKRVGVNSYKIEGYGGLHINPVINKWNCFSQNKGGGPIQFVMFTENKSWVESVKQLLGLTFSNTFNYQKDIKNVKKEDTKGKLVLPKKNNTYKHMIAYLIQTRGIDKDIVYQFIKDKKLYEDKYKNCVFVGHDKDGNAKYASIRGTNTNTERFRGEVKNSNKAYSFNFLKRNSDRLYAFESPIELMSYMSINKGFNHNAISLAGVSDIALKKFLRDNKNIETIRFCLNNDQAGKKATKSLVEKYKCDYSIEVEYPLLKDFNEDIVSSKHVNNEKNYEEVEDEELEI